jgi:uncharacterized protein (DUF1330 family)
MATRSRALIFLLALLLTVVTAVTGYFLYNKNAFVVKKRKEVQVNAMELYAAYTSDSGYAEKKYTDNTLIVSGEVFKIFLNAQQQEVVLLKTTRAQSFINCTFKQPVKNIKPVDKILVKGICSGLGQGYPELGISADVYLAECLPIKEKM